MDAHGVPDNASTISLAGSASLSCQQCEETLANAQERERVLMDALDGASALAARYKSELDEAKIALSELQEKLRSSSDEQREKSVFPIRRKSVGCGNKEVYRAPLHDPNSDEQSDSQRKTRFAYFTTPYLKLCFK
ncbi:hypothetical protein PMAYCL1PPCAC_16513 [Pristionchus mayeri]|uniref:Uncharacterized protein n=1 Tax=Pristionchus mayeri TaxID=1317129 RepID=A0AAN5HZB8_9BILA|nr:hypothetical protein PMAYCL1PPCAC_16513 [Pristionchus mayeri]